MAEQSPPDNPVQPDTSAQHQASPEQPSPTKAGQQPQPGLNPQIQILGGQVPPQIMAQILQGQLRPGVGVQLQLPGIIQQAQHWQGPYPPPEALERYEAILPGTFNRMITMAEDLQKAQIEQSRIALDNTKSDISRGHWLGFVTTAVAMIGCVICVVLEQPYVAALFLSVPVMAVAKALIETSKAPSSKELIEAATQSSTPPSNSPASPPKAGKTQ